MRRPGIAVRWATALLWAWLGAAVLVAPVPAEPTAGVKKPITHDVYDTWRSIQGTQISRDGTWLVYALAPQDGDGELVARNLETNAEHRHPRGKAPVITADGSFVVFAIAPTKADRDKAKRAKKKPEDQPKSGMGILNLSSGAVVTVERVKSFQVPEEGGRFVAYRLEPAPRKPGAGSAAGQEGAPAGPPGEGGRKEPGSDLILRALATGTQTSVAEVAEYAWNRDGSWLAYAVSSKTPARDGVFARRAADGATRALLTGRGNHKSLTFDEKGTQLAFLSDRGDGKGRAKAFTLYHWTPAAPAGRALVGAETPGLPAGMVVSEHGAVEWSKDGARLFFGTAPAPRPEPKGAPEPVKVDIWHWKDPELQSMQKVRADDEKKRSYRAVVHVKERRLVPLAAPDMPSVGPGKEGERAVGTSNLAYRQLVSWDGSYSDVFVVDLRDGSRRKILERSRFGASLSPGGKYLLYWDDRDDAWYAHHAADGRKVNLTGKLGVKFQDETWDTPDAPQPYGIAGWTEGDRSVLLYDRYDIWEVRPDGADPRLLTKGVGRARGLIFRYQPLDPEQRAIPRAKPLLLATRDDNSKETGYYRVAPIAEAGSVGMPDPVKLVMLPKAFGGLVKAKNADTLVFTLQRFEEFPDLWVSDANFAHMRKVSDANPQQARYRWGRSDLIPFRSADGKPLRAILTRPDDFDPSKKYPLLVYIYEERSDALHRYTSPAPGTSINITRYVSNGYLVLQPDIVYETGYPGESALKCVLPAIQEVADMGFVDTGRIGIQGHSWGGYQISYLVTKTGLFRAAQAGAPVVNMVSAYGGIRWGSGASRAFQYEKTQSRIGGPPWDQPLQYIENSPIFWVEKVSTPYLCLHNDQDGAVPWYQGIEFFTALRRLGKEAYLFNYNGEDHGLRDRDNQKHWTVHLAEFFDHYLLGAPRPDWMEQGVPYLERGKRDLSAVYQSGGGVPQ